MNRISPLLALFVLVPIVGGAAHDRQVPTPSRCGRG